MNALEAQRRLRGRNIALGLALGGLALVLFLGSLAKLMAAAS